MRGLQLQHEGRARLLGGQRLPQLRRPVARTAVLGRLTWRVGARSSTSSPETPRVKTLMLRRARLARASRGPARRCSPDRRRRLPGAAQLLDRVGAGRYACRAHRRAHRRRRGLARTWPTSSRPGDRIELRGPVGGYFVWEPALGGPLLLVAGGSGVVPLMAMVRARSTARSDVGGTAARLLAQLERRHLPRRVGPAERRRPHGGIFRGGSSSAVPLPKRPARRRSGRPGRPPRSRG